MISNRDIKGLAKLARIEMTADEEKSLTKDVENILEFVSQIQEVETDTKKGEGDLGVNKNTLRLDGEPHRGGEFTEDILREAPQKKSGYFKVKKIL